MLATCTGNAPPAGGSALVQCTPRKSALVWGFGGSCVFFERLGYLIVLELKTLRPQGLAEPPDVRPSQFICNLCARTGAVKPKNLS